jgi:hypothetical protein
MVPYQVTCLVTSHPLSPSMEGTMALGEKNIKITLALWDINLTLTHDGESPEDFATRSKEFATLRMKYDLDRAGVVKP